MLSMGLSSQGYNGHFWDSELWMYPLFALNLIWQNHVLIIVLIVCRKQSKKQPFMVKGAMYPNLMIR
jgi:hypothetical protein